MVRSIHKINIAAIATITVATTALAAIISPVAKADNPQNVDFNVNVAEVLTVDITEPTSWAQGNVDTLLRNKIGVSARTNNSTGVTVSMYANNTNLVNKSDNSSTIPTLDNNITASLFEVNRWGYSLNDSDAGDTGATYSPMTSSTTAPTTILTTVGSGSTGYGAQDVWFGAKANSTKASGTYAQTVNFVAVTGTVDTNDNPAVPTNPSEDVTPSDVIAGNNPTYNSTAGVGTGGQTTYTTRTTNTTTNTKSTTTEVSKGNTVSSYQPAQGVTTSSSIDSGATVATALAVAAAVAATSGTIFFVLAKRRDDDEDEK